MDASNSRVVLYGGGLIGSSAARAMTNAGAHVSVVTRVPPPQAFEVDNWIFGELGGDRQDDLLNGADAVVYAAGSMTPGSQVSSVANALVEQVVPVVRLAERAAAAGVRNFVFISSGGTVYGPHGRLPSHEDDPMQPINAYGMVKAQTELALREVARGTTLRIFVLRVSNPFGPEQVGNRRLGFVAAAIDAALHDHPLRIWGDGTNSRDFVYIDDVGSAIAHAAFTTHPGAVLNIGSGTETTLSEVCALISNISGRPIDTIFEPGRTVDVPHSVLNVDRSMAVLEWRPEISLREGVERILSFLSGS